MDYGFVTDALRRTIEAAEKRRDDYQTRGLNTDETDRVIMDACKLLSENVDNYHDESPLRDRVAVLETENAQLRETITAHEKTIAQLRQPPTPRVTEGSAHNNYPEEEWGYD